MMIEARDATGIIEWNKEKRGDIRNGYDRVKSREWIERGIVVNRKKEKARMITEGDRKEQQVN